MRLWYGIRFTDIFQLLIIEPCYLIARLYRTCISKDKTMWKSYYKHVPLYCRRKCEYVFECRSYERNWKTRNGCRKIVERNGGIWED